jgi:hypothetical protein
MPSARISDSRSCHDGRLSLLFSPQYPIMQKMHRRVEETIHTVMSNRHAKILSPRRCNLPCCSFLREDIAKSRTIMADKGMMKPLNGAHNNSQLPSFDSGLSFLSAFGDGETLSAVPASQKTPLSALRNTRNGNHLFDNSSNN